MRLFVNVFFLTFGGENVYYGALPPPQQSVAAGVVLYDIGTSPVATHGIGYTAEDLRAAIKGPISALMRDDAGTENILELLADVGETQFAAESLKTVLTTKRVPEDWRVGEALAELYLTSHRNCCFPWPFGRDQRDENASLPGTDLVGFQAIDACESSGIRFAFGEVKPPVTRTTRLQ